jgi:hypothetical protein
MTSDSNASTQPVREQVIEFLRREIVGPDPQPSRMQPNGEEILINEPPRIRYAAGVLFPQKAFVEIVESLTESELEETDDETEPAEQIVEDRFDDNARWGKPEDEEAEAGVALTNATQPAALGFSCLCELPQQALIVRVHAATYESRTERIEADGKRPRTQTLHERKPFESEVLIPRDALESERTESTSLAVPRDGASHSGLELRVLSRPFADKNGHTLRLLTVTLINTHEMTEHVLNEKCFFQVELELEDGNGTAIFREYPDASLVSDEEEQSLALLYQHRKTYGVGHGCAVHWQESGAQNGCAGKLWSESFPIHEIKPIAPTSFQDLTLSMHDFSDRGDESRIVPTLEKLCAKYSVWIEEQGAKIENEVPEVHREAAERHLENCRACLARMRDGVELLRENEIVRRAFRLANRAMLSQQLHYELGTKRDPPRVWQKREGVLSIAPYTNYGTRCYKLLYYDLRC